VRPRLAASLHRLDCGSATRIGPARTSRMRAGTFSNRALTGGDSSTCDGSRIVRSCLEFGRIGWFVESEEGNGGLMNDRCFLADMVISSCGPGRLRVHGGNARSIPPRSVKSAGLRRANVGGVANRNYSFVNGADHNFESPSANRRSCCRIYQSYLETMCEEHILAMSSGDQAPVAEHQSKPFVATRNRHIVPKDRRIERLQSGYSVREFRNDCDGRYWFVVTSLEVA
jgi:hypothetical protein